MNNPWDEMRSALETARELNRAVDNSATAMADILKGRLRNVSGDTLASLKRELREFNIQTRAWKDEP